MSEENKKLPDSIREKIREDAAALTEETINQRIVSEKKKVLGENGLGDGTFFGFLKAIIFAIADFLGFSSWLSQQFGGPAIPSNTEVKVVSSQVAEATSRAMTEKDYDSKEEMQTAVTKAVQNELSKDENRAKTQSFTAAQLQEMAQEAGNGATAHYDRIHGIFNPPPPTKVEAPALTASKDDNVKNLVGALVDGTAKSPGFPNVGSDAITRMKEIGTQIVLTNEPLVKARDMDTLADKYADALLKDDTIKSAINIPATVAKPILKSRLVSILNDNKDALNAALEGTVSTEPVTVRVPNTPIDISGILAKKVSDEIAVGTALEYAAKGYGPEDAKATINQYYQKVDGKYERVQTSAPLSSQEEQKIANAHKALYEDALKHNLTFNQKQRDYIGELVGETVQTELAKKENANKSQEELATILETAINKKLVTKTSEIDNRASGGGWGLWSGTTVKALNDGTILKGYQDAQGDILGKISKEFGNAVRKNKNGAYDQAKQFLLSPATASLDSNMKNAVAQYNTGHTPPSKQGESGQLTPNPISSIQPGQQTQLS